MASSNALFLKTKIKKGKRDDFSEKELAFLRSGNGSKINVFEFKESHYKFWKKLHSRLKNNISNSLKNGGFSCDDLKISSSSDIINKYIEKHAEKITPKNSDILLYKFEKNRLYEKASALKFELNPKMFEDFENNFGNFYKKSSPSKEWHEMLRKKELKNIVITNPLDLSFKQSQSFPKNFRALAPNEALIKVSIYNRGCNKIKSEFYVTGTNSLKNLRDVIPCTNYGVRNLSYLDCVESSESNKNKYNNGDRSKPIGYVKDVKLAVEIEERNEGFFFIEDTFYLFLSNLADKSDLKMAEFLKKFNCVEGTGFEEKYEKRFMESISFDDLDLEMGKIYLYSHKFCCDHFIMFSDLRIISKNDPINGDLYPLLTYQRRKIYKNCDICKKIYAKYVTYGDLLSSKNGQYFCHDCYVTLHCDKDGNLLKNNDFETYFCNLD